MTCRWTVCLHGGRSTQNGDAWQFDVLVETDVPEAVDEVDELTQVVEKRLVRLRLCLLHTIYYHLTKFPTMNTHPHPR
jgi:hypothetical protein